MSDKFSTVPKDIIIYIGLTMDLPEILSLCQVSKNFDDVICKNSNFWYNKLKQDFDIDRKDTYTIQVVTDYDPSGSIRQWISMVDKQLTPKEYYQYIRNELLKDTLNKIMFNSVKNEDLDLLKAAITKGADVNELDNMSNHVLHYTLYNRDPEIAKYLANLPQLDKNKIPDIEVMDPSAPIYFVADNFMIYRDEMNQEVFDYLTKKKLIKTV